MLSNIKAKLRSHYINSRGWRTGRKIVVFESDDWGAIRMSSKKNLYKLADLGIETQNCHYVQNDALASEEDLNRLFEILRSHKDSRGKNPVLTANTIMTNPDFKKIKASGFTEYHYETFTESLTKYPEHINSFNMWKGGIKEGLFKPQFHGREHLQVKRWMKFLNKTNSETRRAFDYGVFGLSTSVTSEVRKSYMASYDWDDRESRNFIIESIPDGLSLFKSIFGFKSLSSIAPNYVWHQDVEQVLRDQGVKYIQGSGVQKSPEIEAENSKIIRHYTGQKNELGQSYLVRNCQFEPSSNPGLDWLDKCMRDIKTAFFWKKPAIVEMHRVNFIGYIHSENRDRNLKVFNKLLQKIIQVWPEIEFMTSDQLGKIIENNE